MSPRVKTQGLSPKVIADATTSVVGFLLAHFVVGLDPTTAAAIAKAAGSLAAYLAHPGKVA